MNFSKKFFALFFVISFIPAFVAGKWPSNVTEIKIKRNSTVTLKGNLKKGKIISNLRFASRSSVACFPSTQNKSFQGNHVFFGSMIPAYSIMKITVIPQRGLDVSLYAYSVGTGSFNRFPPDLYSAVSCEASYNRGRSNPGKPESVILNAIRNPYNVVIGVAGPRGVTKGDFILKIDLKTRKEEPKISGKLNVTNITSKKNGTVQVKGRLQNGRIIPVRWCNSSQTACFPATVNDKFRGNTVLFRTQLPSYSRMKITAVPGNRSVDLNLYAYRISSTDYKTLPPNVGSVVCESSLSYRGGNPGKPESVEFNSAGNPYNIVILVAGPVGVTKGDFILKIELKSR